LPQAGYNFITASCTGATNNGTLSDATISGIQVSNQDIVSCTFYNRHLQCTQDSDCSDGLYCNGIETCVNNTCVAGTSVNCSQYDISGIATCTNDPDNNPFTWDYRNAFTSQCNEDTDSCTIGNSEINHTCDVTHCQAQCDATHLCANTICSTQSGCQGNDYYTYNDVANSCTEGCTCTENACGTPTISYNDSRCTECQTNEKCASLNRDYCDGTVIKHDTGICNLTTYKCETQTTTIQNCNDGLVCNGVETCNNAQCVAGTPVDCSNNNLLAIATCANDPDNNPFTWDYRNAFTSVCQESTGTCTTGDSTINHTCDITQCQAQCVTNSDCSLGQICTNCTCVTPQPTPECTPQTTAGCSTGLQGICAAGTKTCNGDGFWGSCIQNNQPITEICGNGLDDDCDGIVDNGCPSPSPSPFPSLSPQPTPFCGDELCNGDETCSTCPADCGSCGGGGGGGGGEPSIYIFNEQNGEITTATAIVNWYTNLVGTSRVVYDTVSHSDYTLGTAPNYGYAYSTSEDSNKVTAHSVTITGLTPGVDYYWRAISHGSGEAWSREVLFTTVAQAPSGPSGPTWPECTPSLTRVCDTGKAGICADGTQTCDQTGLWGTCVQNTQATTEICGNGMDDNCNGLIDNADPACQQAVTNPVPTPSVSPVSPTPIAPVEIKIIPTPANESISNPTPAPSPEGITQENPARTGLLLAAIGNFFKGNVCRILNLAMIILIILGMLSLWRKVRNSKGKERKIALALYAVISVIVIFILVRYWQNCVMAIPLALIAAVLSIINKLLKKEQIIQIPQVK